MSAAAFISVFAAVPSSAAATVYVYIPIFSRLDFRLVCAENTTYVETYMQI